MKRALVTGGAGYIGSHLTRALQAQGWEVTTLDIEERGHIGDLGVVGDIRDPHVYGDSWDIVFHLAAKSIVSEGERKPLDYYDTNVTGTINLLRNLPDKTPIVFASSGAVYGQEDYPAAEYFSPVDPASVYGSTKHMGEEVIRSTGRPSAILRYFNVAGGTDNPKRPRTHLIHRLAAGDPITIFGTNYEETRDGTAVRDYVHVEDVCRATLLAAEYLLGGQSWLTMNVGSGVGHSVREVIDAAIQVFGRGDPVVGSVEEARECDPPYLVADLTFAKKKLGYEPKFDLEAILKSYA